MEQLINFNRTETLSREIIKSAFSMGNSKLSEKAAKEITHAASHAFSLISIAALTNDQKEKVDKINLSIEKLALLKFWIDFSISENISPKNMFLSFSQQLSELQQELASLRKKEEAKLVLSSSYAGEWFLDD